MLCIVRKATKEGQHLRQHRWLFVFDAFKDTSQLPLVNSYCKRGRDTPIKKTKPMIKSKYLLNILMKERG